MQGIQLGYWGWLGMRSRLPEQCSEKVSPYAENFLFGNAGLSFDDLNWKGIVVFTVKWPKRS